VLQPDGVQPYTKSPQYDNGDMKQLRRRQESLGTMTMNKTIQMLLAQPYLRCYFPTENGTWVSYCVELDLSSMGYSVAEATAHELVE